MPSRAIWRFGFVTPLTAGGSKRPTAIPREKLSTNEFGSALALGKGTLWAVMARFSSNVTTDTTPDWLLVNTTWSVAPNNAILPDATAGWSRVKGDVFGPYGIGSVERRVGVSFASNE